MSTGNLLRFTLISSLIFIVCIFSGSTTLAGGVGEAMGDFLNIGVDARSSAMGGAYTAVVDNASASYWNPGALAHISSPQLSASHFDWLQDVSYDFLSIAYPACDRLTLAASATYLGYGTIEGYDIHDTPIGEITSTYDFMTGLSAGFHVSENVMAGLTAKYVVISLAGRSASTVVFDAGAQVDLERLVLGVTLSNFGSKIKVSSVAEPLPTSLRAGVAVQPFGNTMIVSLESEHQFYGDFHMKTGTELIFQDRYFMRAGYCFTPGASGLESSSRLSVGGGIKLGQSQLDYTYSPGDTFSADNIHQFSIIFRL